MALNNTKSSWRYTTTEHVYVFFSAQNWGLVTDVKKVLQGSSPFALELRMRVGQSHEQLVLQLQWRFSEDGGWSVVQSRRPANVKSLFFYFFFFTSTADVLSNMMTAKQIVPDAPVFLQVVLHCVGNTKVVSGQRPEEVFIPGRTQEPKNIYLWSFLPQL